jgi:hypothetical protein
MDIIESYDQQSDEWFAETAGSIGGSSITTVVSKGAGRGKLLLNKAAEIISGRMTQSKDLWQYKRGNEFEPDARKYYCMMNRIKVRQVALARLTQYKHHSPDFLRDEDGYGEIKIRIPSVFLQALDEGVSTSDRRQVQWGFRIMGRAYCDYIQFCPEFVNSSVSPILVKRIYPDDAEIKFLDMGADKFIGELINYVTSRETK